MKAGGPCDHCGRTHSCCWRRGPANKPILCNACGSRYLVKRNLDNYVPLATRHDRAAAKEAGAKEAAVQRRAAAPAAGRVTKAKRSQQKRLDFDAWSSDLEESQTSGACHTDDSAASQRAGLAGHRAVASKLKLSYGQPRLITSQTQLKELDSSDLSTLTGVLFTTSTLRLKPRKPVVVTVSAVW